MKHSTSQRSRRQSLAQGGASEASGTLGNGTISFSARFSGRKNLPPAKAGSRNQMALESTGSASLHPWLHSAAGFAGWLRGKRLVKPV